jgi:hypothetical protein
MIAGWPRPTIAGVRRLEGAVVSFGPKLSNELRRLASQLRMHGLNVNFERRHEGRIITLKSERVPIVPPEFGGKKPETS